MIDVKKILTEKGPLFKFQGNAPEGFQLILEKTLEDLKDFDVWKEWKSNSDFFQQLIRKHIDMMD